MLFSPRFTMRPPRGALLENRAPPKSPSKHGQYMGFSHGRTALKHGLLHLGVKKGDRILMPDLICEVVPQTIIALGLQPEYYTVNENLLPDWRTLRTQAKNNIKALIMVHYFGVPQQLEQYMELCREQGIYLIEDNAHGFGGSYKDTPLGNFGDIAISSPWKNFPVSTGGILHLNSGNRDSIDFSNFMPIPHSFSWLRLIRKCRMGWILSNRRYFIALQKRPAPKPIADLRMKHSDMERLNKLDFKLAASKRRKIYRVWQDWGYEAGLVPVIPDIHKGASPLVFPAYAETRKQAIYWFEKAWKNGIEASSWPKLPMDTNHDFDNANRLWEKMICFPIHQDMDARDLHQTLRHTLIS